MFFFTEPYISDIAKDFINSAEQQRVIENSFLNSQSLNNPAPFLTSQEAAKKLTYTNGRWLYCNSENALSWLDEVLPKPHRLRNCIELFKNKHLFRERYKKVFSDVEFELISASELLTYQFENFGKPFIIKPTIGFLSAGVYRINSQYDLERVQNNLLSELQTTESLFPKSVLDSSSFILEGVIDGREFAIDAFYTADHRPVITNIFEHIFRDEDDMSDRLYITSSAIISKYLKPFTEFLELLQQDIDLEGFVLHAEIRVDSDGTIRPIEINPLRFAGWCSTDLAYWAYGINPYEQFSKREGPDWSEILRNTDRKVYGMSVISSTDISTVNNFDYTKLASKFKDLKEIRQIDHKKYPIFGFAFFAMAEDDMDFSNWLLNTDFREFCS